MNNNSNIAIQYVDNSQKPTERYPYNPNGSKQGIAGVSSKNNRHLALMPHPERTFLKWQLPYEENKIKNHYTPWFQLFLNARKWINDV